MPLFYLFFSVTPRVAGCKPVDMAQIDGILPLLSPAQQMAGGLQSPDIHQCHAVRCSHSGALTSRLVPQPSLPPPLPGLSLMMPLNEVPFSCEHFKISWRSFADTEPFSLLTAAVVNAFQAPGKEGGKISKKFRLSWIPVYKSLQGSHKAHYVMTLCAVGCVSASVSLPNRNVIIAGAWRSKTTTNIKESKWPWLCVWCHWISHFLTTTSVHKGTSKREKQSSH